MRRDAALTRFTFSGQIMRTLPRGYAGRNHHTIGSDILAVLHATSLPATTLGAETAARLAAVDAAGWYPIDWLLDLMDQLYAKSGPGGVRRMGRALFKLSHAEQVRRTAGSARDIVYGIDGMYRRANRGSGIGGWTVLAFTPGYAELEKTTPHHCVMEEGILSEALHTVGAPAVVSQRECVRNGAAACRYVIRSTVRDARWG